MASRRTPEAERDIAALYEYGALTFGLAAAARYAEGLRETLNFLAEFPRAAREREEVDPPVRVYPYGAHLIAYRIEDEDVVVVRVLHQRSEWIEEL